MYTHWSAILLFGCHLASAAEYLRPAAPLVTGILNARQILQCPAMQTACADGTGCCPDGAACTYVGGQPRCAIGCGGGPTCANGGCCQAGYACDANDQLCHVAMTAFPTPLSSSNPGGPMTPASSNPGGPMTPTSAPGGGSTSSGASQTSGATSSMGASSSMSGSASGSASPTAPATGTAVSLSLDWESWMMWVFAWAVGLPLMT